MMGLGEIRRLSREACNRARHRGLRPRVPTIEERACMARGEYGTFRFPNLGGYVPAGWELIETHFVDKSGFGSAVEPALQQSALARRIASLPPEHGYAMIEEGQFQYYIGEFKLKAKRARKVAAPALGGTLL